MPCCATSQQLKSSSAKRNHYDALLAQPLPAAELQRVVVQAGKEVASSSDLRAVLSKAATQSRTGGVAGSSLETAIGAVASSSDRTAVLEAFGQTDDRDQLLSVMRVAATIPSQCRQGEPVERTRTALPRPQRRRAARCFFKTVVTIPSSSDLASVLDDVIPFAVKSNDVALAIIAADTTVPSSTRPRQRAHRPRRAWCHPHARSARRVPARRAGAPLVDRHAQRARSAHPPLTPHRPSGRHAVTPPTSYRREC